MKNVILELLKLINCPLNVDFFMVTQMRRAPKENSKMYMYYITIMNTSPDSKKYSLNLEKAPKLKSMLKSPLCRLKS